MKNNGSTFFQEYFNSPNSNSNYNTRILSFFDKGRHWANQLLFIHFEAEFRTSSRKKKINLCDLAQASKSSKQNESFLSQCTRTVNYPENIVPRFVRYHEIFRGFPKFSLTVYYNICLSFDLLRLLSRHILCFVVFLSS